MIISKPPIERCYTTGFKIDGKPQSEDGIQKLQTPEFRYPSPIFAAGFPYFRLRTPDFRFGAIGFRLWTTNLGVPTLVFQPPWFVFCRIS